MRTVRLNSDRQRMRAIFERNPERALFSAKRLAELSRKQGFPRQVMKPLRCCNAWLSVGRDLRLLGLRDELLHNRQSLLVVGVSFSWLSVGQQGAGELSVRSGDINLLVRVVGLRGGEVLPQCERAPIIANSLGVLAIGRQGPSELFMNVGERTLAARIVGLGGRELLPDGNSPLVIGDRFGLFAISQQRIGEPSINVGESALADGIAGLGGREFSLDGESLLVIGDGFGAFAIVVQGIGQSSIAEAE